MRFYIGSDSAMLKRMDTNKMLAELRMELQHLDEAILVLERLALGSGKRRGRPPSWLKNVAASVDAPAAAPNRRGRPPGSTTTIS